jgi:hypothetical protein
MISAVRESTAKRILHPKVSLFGTSLELAIAVLHID